MRSGFSLFGTAKILALVLVAIVTGCAPAPRAGKPAKDRASIVAGLALSNVEDDANWRCPDEEYNVKLKDGVNFNGFDYSGNHSFEVCVSRDDTSRFRVSGVTSSRAICIYPMHVGYYSSVELVEAPKCFNITGSEMIVDFERQDINYMSIVDVNYAQAMSDCLSGSTACPPHSEGFVQ